VYQRHKPPQEIGATGTQHLLPVWTQTPARGDFLPVV
jgi:hypothetical protein